jgi:peroxiredoxin
MFTETSSANCWLDRIPVELRATFGFVICCAIATAPCSADAGEYNQVLSIGDAAPAWTDLPGTDGKTHSLTDYKNREVLVLVFTCVSCAASVDYEDRINELTKKYGGKEGKAAVVAVCVNRVKGDTLPDLTERAKQREFAFDYVYDESQKIAKDYGAIFTPEFYVFDRDRKLVYMGALDDVSDAAKVTKKYVEAAIEATLKGEAPPLKETIARGCRVRYVRERK